MTGAGPVVIVQWWSTEFTTPLGSLMPPARVNVYEVLGAKIARGWSSVKPGVAGQPDDPAGRERSGAERGREVARGDRPAHREPTLDRRRHHRPVELDGDRRVGSDPDGAAVRGATG